MDNNENKVNKPAATESPQREPKRQRDRNNQNPESRRENARYSRKPDRVKKQMEAPSDSENAGAATKDKENPRQGRPNYRSRRGKGGNGAKPNASEPKIAEALETISSAENEAELDAGMGIEASEPFESEILVEDEPNAADVLVEEPDESPVDGKPNVPFETEIVGVRFKKSGKIYYFDPSGFEIKKEQDVIVETARGIEYGTVMIENRMVRTSQVVLPLRNVIRIATPEDKQHRDENAKKETEAFNICIEKIEVHKLQMKLVDVEYTFDNNKLLFYFTADGRIDFRDLVKDLASVFRTRIELRQIRIRDEAKMMGGLGICGRPFCCHSFLADFVQVSIKMAKEQNLSLNSSKISGACGRLMCCLRYEYDTYDEEIRKTPPVDSVVRTADGEGTVVEISPLAGTVKVRLRGSDQPPKSYKRDDVVKLKTVAVPAAPVKRDPKKRDENISAAHPVKNEVKDEKALAENVETAAETAPDSGVSDN